MVGWKVGGGLIGGRAPRDPGPYLRGEPAKVGWKGRWQGPDTNSQS